MSPQTLREVEARAGPWETCCIINRLIDQRKCVSSQDHGTHRRFMHITQMQHFSLPRNNASMRRPEQLHFSSIFCVTYSTRKLTGAKAAAEVARRAAMASFILTCLTVANQQKGDNGVRMKCLHVNAKWSTDYTLNVQFLIPLV